jgi:hypothetical protein
VTRSAFRPAPVDGQWVDIHDGPAGKKFGEETPHSLVFFAERDRQARLVVLRYQHDAVCDEKIGVTHRRD